MEDDVIKELKLIAAIWKFFAYVIPVAIIAVGIKYYYDFIDSTTINVNVGIDTIPMYYYLVLILLAVLSAIALYAKSSQYKYKALMLENIFRISINNNIDNNIENVENEKEDLNHESSGI